MHGVRLCIIRVLQRLWQLTEDNKIVMERQFRYALQQTLLEVPAGKLDPNEEPIVCAKRETC